ncbi:GNAT family N-acetyltransferase [Devosia sp.]|uniref:GNAT family N-acetyltransferase n=1 Tax=Devosia sp. TaxID=1871048 RepID=UPI00326547F7
MSQTYTVQRQDQNGHGRYMVDLGDGFEAEMTYRKVADKVIAIDHTGVPPEFGGRGIAAQLVNAAISDARSDGFKIVPLCSYVVAQFKRHPEWADLRAQ